MLDRLRDRLRLPLDRAQRRATGSGPGRSYDAGASAQSLRAPVGGHAPAAGLEQAPTTAGTSEEQEFEHAPDATPDEVPAAKKIGFDGKEIREHGPQSGHTPSGGAGGGF